MLLLLAETWHRTEIQGQDSFRRVRILLQSPLLDVGIDEYYTEPLTGNQADTTESPSPVMT